MRKIRDTVPDPDEGMKPLKRVRGKDYDEWTRIEGIIRCAATGNDYDKVGAEMGIPPGTLRSWMARKSPYKSFTVGLALDRALKQILIKLPAEMNARDWAVAVGILTDKWLLMQGQPTSRTEDITHMLGTLPHEGMEEVLEEAQRIIDEAQKEKHG